MNSTTFYENERFIYKIDRSSLVYRINKKTNKVKQCHQYLRNNSNAKYLCVTVDKKIEYVHRIMAKTFLNVVFNDSDDTIDHIDSNKFNNNICNLRLLKRGDNTKAYFNCDHFTREQKRFIYDRCARRFDVLNGVEDEYDFIMSFA